MFVSPRYLIVFVSSDGTKTMIHAYHSDTREKGRMNQFGGAKENVDTKCTVPRMYSWRSGPTTTPLQRTFFLPATLRSVHFRELMHASVFQIRHAGNATRLRPLLQYSHLRSSPNWEKLM